MIASNPLFLQWLQVKLSLIWPRLLFRICPPSTFLQSAPTNINYRKKERQKRRSVDHIAREWFGQPARTPISPAEKRAKTIFPLGGRAKNRFTATLCLFRFDFHSHSLYHDDVFASMRARASLRPSVSTFGKIDLAINRSNSSETELLKYL